MLPRPSPRDLFCRYNWDSKVFHTKLHQKRLAKCNTHTHRLPKIMSGIDYCARQTTQHVSLRPSSLTPYEKERAMREILIISRRRTSRAWSRKISWFVSLFHAPHISSLYNSLTCAIRCNPSYLINHNSFFSERVADLKWRN